MGRTILFLLLLFVSSLSASLMYQRNLDGSWTPQMAQGGEEEEDPIPIDNIKASRHYGFKNTRRSSKGFLDDQYNTNFETTSYESGRTSNFFHRLPSIEKSLLKDVIRIIMKNDDYMSFLSNPSFPELKNIVQKMIQDPSQRVIRRQVLNKVHSIEQLYNRFYKPLTETKIKGDAMKIVLDLIIASRKNTLTAEDANELDDKAHLFAILMQDSHFRAAMKKLERDSASHSFTDNRINSKRNTPSIVSPAQPSAVDYPPPYDYPGKPQLTDEAQVISTLDSINMPPSDNTKSKFARKSASNDGTGGRPEYTSIEYSEDSSEESETDSSHSRSFLDNRIFSFRKTPATVPPVQQTTKSYNSSGIPIENHSVGPVHYPRPTPFTRTPVEKSTSAGHDSTTRATVVTTPNAVHGSTTKTWDHSTKAHTTRAPSQNETTTHASIVLTTTVLPKLENSSSVPTTGGMSNMPITTQKTIDEFIVDPGAQY